MRVGEYYFRAFNPSGPPVNEYLALAFGEFTEILALDPQNQQAMIYRNNILSNENILGLPRDIDLIPDFEHYQGIVRDYGPIVLSLFSTATNLLTTGVPMDQKRQELNLEIAHLQGLTDVLTAEVAEAELALVFVQTEIRLLDSRLAGIQRRIQERMEELNSKELSIGDTLLIMGDIAIAIIGIYTGGSSLVSVVPAIIKLQGTLQGKDLVQLISDKELRDQAKEDAGGVKEAVDGIKNGVDALISLSKMYAQLANAIPPSSNDAVIGSLLREATELTHQKKLALMRVVRAEAALDIARRKLALAENDLILARQRACRAYRGYRISQTNCNQSN